MPDNMGNKIKERRLALRMTLTELGDKVGVGASTVRKWETGYIKDVRSDKIYNLASALEIKPDELMGWEENQNINIDSVNSNNGIIGQTNAPVTINNGAVEVLSKEEIELLRVYKKINVKRRMKLLATALDLEDEEDKSE